MTEPLAESLERHRKPLYALYAPVYEDPRVAAWLAEDARRYEAMRTEVIAMLQRPEWDARNLRITGDSSMQPVSSNRQ
jgi:hypothetical protein